MKKERDDQLKKIEIDRQERILQLEDREKKLRAREAKNETEKRKLDNEKKMVLNLVFYIYYIIFKIIKCFLFAEWIGDFGAEEGGWKNVEVSWGS